jgi:CHAT domain-containing protein/tetratricopeptide (TPR) repeat protein
LSGCHAASTPDPAAVYQGIEGDFRHGNLDAAYRKAVEAREAFSAAGFRADPAWGLKFRLLEADILVKQGHWPEVIALLTADGVAFPASGDLAIKRDLLCSRAHYYLGRLPESERELQEARRLAESAHSPSIGEVLRAEGLALRDAGNWDQALEKFKGSLGVSREQGDRWLEAVNLVELGFVSLQSDRFDQALVWSQQAADLAKSLQAPRQVQLAMGNMGWAYMNLGDFDNALVNFQAAETQAKAIGMGASRVAWLQDAGLADYRLGNLQAARQYDEEALAAALKLPAANEVDDVVRIETNLALLLYGQDQYAAAKTYSDAAAAAARQSKDDKVVAYAGFIEGLIAARLATGEEAERLLMQSRQTTTDPETKMEIESALANFYVERRQSSRAELWYRRSIQTFELNRASIQSEALRLSAFAYGDAVYRDYAQFLIGANRPGEALRLLDRSRARTLEEGLGVADPVTHASGTDRREPQAVDRRDPQAVARELHAPILFYSLGVEKSYLWVITPQETRLFILPKRSVIQSLVQAYQRSIQKSLDPLQTADPGGVSLYDVLVKPAAAMIPAGSKVFVIPDGVLHALNFETLLEPTANGFRYWIEDVVVTTTSSIAILSRWNAAGADTATRDLLLIGNPVSAGTEFQALPNASAEMARVGQHFSPQGQSVLAQARAVPAAYEASGPDQFRYIHFVAHGTASLLSPLDSAVVLSPAPGHGENFKLYARDIVQHPLHARLVTISACYGSGLRTYAGEGLVGLAWAFLRAGSHNVIGALWQVDDASTPLLMDQLYGEIEAGKAPDAALRTAKLSLIHSASVYRKPFYWGAFQLYAGS